MALKFTFYTSEAEGIVSDGYDEGNLLPAYQHLAYMSRSFTGTLLLLRSLYSAPAKAQTENKSPQPSYSSLSAITPASDFFFFVLNDDLHGLELWRSDGTTTGTHIVRDIFPGGQSSTPSKFLLVDDVLYFIADDGVHGEELWRSDGTESGTVLVKDIFKGSTSSSIDFITPVKNAITFQADNGIDGTELWTSDGTSEGTKLLKDINEGDESSYPDYFTVLDNDFYFRATSAQYGYELWKSDGTNAGTVLVKDIAQGRSDSSPLYITRNNHLLFFAASVVPPQFLYKSDGTGSGTISLNRGPYPLELLSVNETLFFTASQDKTGRELWKSDGTINGTVLVKDIFPGEISAIGFNNAYLCSLNNVVYLAAGDSKNGKELWRSDGSAEGTQLIKDINPGVGESYISDLVSVNGSLYFSAYNGVHGSELWKSDGTAAGTIMVKDIMPGSDSSIPRNFKDFKGKVYFSVFGDDGIELWITDGTSSGTKRIFPAAEELSPAYVNAPADGSEDQKVDLNIASRTVSGATTYTIQISTTSDFKSNVVTKIGARSQRFTSLAYNTTYYARVKTNLGASYGRITSFTTTSPVAYSYIISPKDNETDVSANVNITSNLVPQAGTYTIELNTDESFAATSGVVKSGGRTLKFTGLDPEKKYYSRVRTNLSSDWGMVKSFQVIGASSENAIADNGSNLIVSVSPNPFQNKIIFRVDTPDDDKALIVLRDLNNREFFSSVEPTNLPLEYELPLTPGLYVLHVKTSRGTKSIRVAKVD